MPTISFQSLNAGACLVICDCLLKKKKKEKRKRKKKKKKKKNQEGSYGG